MKYIYLLLLVLNNLSIFCNNNLKEKNIVNQKKHELSIALHYAHHKYGDHPTNQIRLLGPDDRFNYNNVYDSVNVGKKVGHGIGLRVQYNYFLKPKIFLSTSVNLFFYKPAVVKFDWTKNSNTFPYDLYHPILSHSQRSGKVAYTANQTYVDIGIGFIPIQKNKFNWRIGIGFGLGYHFYTDPIVDWSYDFVYVPELNETYLNFHGFRPYVLNSILYGGFAETSLNYELIKDKISLGINYKFLYAKKYKQDGVYPQSFGLICNIKL